MSENLRIDSHKLIFHPERVAQWLNDQITYPIEAEFSLSGACNHRCIFCALEYTGYRPAFLKRDTALSTLAEMRRRGLKSVIFSGEGEPLLNPEAPHIIRGARDLGLDLAMSSNGVLLTEDFARQCLGDFAWIRFSVSAGTPETYQLIHNGRSDDLDRVLTNLARAVEIKREHQLSTTLGVQLLLIRQNLAEVMPLARTLREIGIDYFTVKPFSKHPMSQHDLDFDYANCHSLALELAELETPTFQVFYRENSMKKIMQARRYTQCWGMPFFAHIDTQGNVWPCVAFVGDEKLLFGNIHERNFSEIWEGKARKEALDELERRGIEECRKLCRLDEINAYLQELKTPGRHANFI